MGRLRRTLKGCPPGGLLVESKYFFGSIQELRNEPNTLKSKMSSPLDFLRCRAPAFAGGNLE